MQAEPTPALTGADVETAAIPFGLRVSDGRMVGVLEVSRGLTCGCVCAECRKPLVAAKGLSRVAYFRHDGSVCASGRETAIHEAAKQILRDVRSVEVKPREVIAVGTSIAGHVVSEAIVLQPGMSLRFDMVELERSFPDGVVADAHGIAAGEQYIMEVWVRHPVDERKLQRLKGMNLPALEIDLHDIRLCSYEELESYVTRCPDRTHWLHFPGKAQAAQEADEALRRRLDAADAAAQVERASRSFHAVRTKRQ
jgi:hypothetical protein